MGRGGGTDLLGLRRVALLTHTLTPNVYTHTHTQCKIRHMPTVCVRVMTNASGAPGAGHGRPRAVLAGGGRLCGGAILPSRYAIKTPCVSYMEGTDM